MLVIRCTYGFSSRCSPCLSSCRLPVFVPVFLPISVAVSLPVSLPASLPVVYLSLSLFSFTQATARVIITLLRNISLHPTLAKEPLTQVLVLVAQQSERWAFECAICALSFMAQSDIFRASLIEKGCISAMVGAVIGELPCYCLTPSYSLSLSLSHSLSLSLSLFLSLPLPSGSYQHGQAGRGCV